MKTAIITGASAGLGLEFVRQIKDHFPEIECYWLLARNPGREPLPQIPGVELRPMAVNLTTPESIAQLQEALAAEQPQVELLIGCAGCGYLGNFDESDPEEQLRMVSLNVSGLTAVTHAVLPYMPNGSRIINISSIASFVPTARMTIYSATKAYVSAFSRGLHTELKPRNISVTAVCPGPMDTEFIRAGRIKGQSKTFDILPYCIPMKVVKGALKAAKKGVPSTRLCFSTKSTGCWPPSSPMPFLFTLQKHKQNPGKSGVLLIPMSSRGRRGKP